MQVERNQIEDLMRGRDMGEAGDFGDTHGRHLHRLSEIEHEAVDSFPKVAALGMVCIGRKGNEQNAQSNGQSVLWPERASSCTSFNIPN